MLKEAELRATTPRNLSFDAGNLLVEGIGSLSNARIRTAGLCGGGLASGTSDGWSVERHPFAFPEQALIVSPPRQTMLWTAKGEDMKLTKLIDYEIRALRSQRNPAAHCVQARATVRG